MADSHKNFAYSTVLTAPSPATTGTSIVLAAGGGALMPAPPFNATVWPLGVLPLASNAEIVRVTGIASDTLTVERKQESSMAQSIQVGFQFAATITAKALTDVEPLHGEATPAGSLGTEGQVYYQQNAAGEPVALYGPKFVATIPNPYPSAVLDTFGRAAESPLAALSWHPAFYEVTGARNPLGVTSSGLVSATAGENGSALWNAGPWADTDVYGTVHAIASYLNLHLRVTAVSGSAWTGGYRVKFAAPGVGNYCAVYRADGVKLGEVGGVGLVEGSEVWARMRGKVLSVYHKKPAGEWVLLISVSDSTYASGQIGVACGTSGDVWSSFGGGEVIVASNPTWGAPSSLYAGTSAVFVPPPTGTAATDTANAKEAIKLAQEKGQARVEWQAGEYLINETLTVYSKTWHKGQGRGVTIIKLAANSNCDLFQSSEFKTYTGTHKGGGISLYAFSDMTVDANGAVVEGVAQQSLTVASYCLRAYGQVPFLDNVAFINGRYGCLWLEFSISEGGGSSLSSELGGSSLGHVNNCHVFNYIGPGVTAGELAACKTTSGSATVTVPNIDGIIVGTPVSAPGILPAGTRVKELRGPTSVLLTANAEATETSCTLKFELPCVGFNMAIHSDCWITDTSVASFNALGGNGNVKAAKTVFGLLVATTGVSIKASQLHAYGRHTYICYLQAPTCYLSNCVFETGDKAACVVSSASSIVGGNVLMAHGNLFESAGVKTQSGSNKVTVPAGTAKWQLYTEVLAIAGVIPAGTTVTAILSETEVELSANAEKTEASITFKLLRSPEEAGFQIGDKVSAGGWEDKECVGSVMLGQVVANCSSSTEKVRAVSFVNDGGGNTVRVVTTNSTTMVKGTPSVSDVIEIIPHSEAAKGTFQSVGPSPGSSITVLSASGSATIPAGAVGCAIVCIGGGGGGGSGAREPLKTAAFGGGGGGTGALSSVVVQAKDFSAGVAVTVGKGGAGGKPVEADGTVGEAGKDGEASLVANYLQASGGKGGAGGTTTAGAGGAGGTQYTQRPGVAGGASSATTSGSPGELAHAGGGGAGGSLSTAEAVIVAGKGGNGTGGQLNGGAAGVGAVGEAGKANTKGDTGGGGGGGGGATLTGGFAGGAGGKAGAGGGGGGASANGNASGEGGKGADGLVVVTTW